jgi:DNA-binding XRE family transcriptional regulator
MTPKKLGNDVAIRWHVEGGLVVMEASQREERVAANRVREIREEHLMTREELARRAGVSLRTVWSVESGHECRLETKRAILRALSIPRSQHRLVFPRSGPMARNAAVDEARVDRAPVELSASPAAPSFDQP